MHDIQPNTLVQFGVKKQVQEKLFGVTKQVQGKLCKHLAAYQLTVSCARRHANSAAAEQGSGYPVSILGRRICL